TLLVFGGSRGARSINRALLAHLPDLLPYCQVLHISGTLDADEVQREAEALAGRIGEQLAARYHTYSYLHSDDMALALAAADLVLSRAGASTLGEFPLFGLPAILVPYPHAWRYQKTNADYLTTQGAAMRLDDDQLNDRLTPIVMQLLNRDTLEQMAAASRALRRPDAARRAAEMLVEMAHTATNRG
ncbi:MAG TPA: glycosyltransferase, partial [Aggregatilineales bacterium]|nr:glycosyltransferase [Aggregatilineales bacterium]